MDIRKIEPREDTEEEVLAPQKTKRKSRKKEKEPSPISGLLAIVVIIAIGVLFVFSTLTNSEPKVRGVQDKREEVKSSKEVKEAEEAIKERVQDRLDGVKEQVEGLTEEDLVTNSSQVQKIITDLEALQGLPAGSAREVCESICSSFGQ